MIEPPIITRYKEMETKSSDYDKLETKVNVLLGKVAHMSKQIEHIEVILCKLYNMQDNVKKGKIKPEYVTPSPTKKKNIRSKTHIDLFEYYEIENLF